MWGLRGIDRGPPLSFAPKTALAEADIEQALTVLVPRNLATMTQQMIAEGSTSTRRY